MNTYAKEIVNQYKTLSASELVEYYSEHYELISRNDRADHSIKTIGVYYYTMRPGGVEKVISLLIPLWQQEGYRVVLFTEEEPSPEDFPVPKSVIRVVIPTDSEGIDNHLVAFENALIEHKVDMLIQNEWYNNKVFPQMLIVKRHHIPFVLYTHNLFSAIYGYLDDYTLNSHKIFSMCDKVLTLSEVNHQFYKLCGCNSLLVQNPIEDNLVCITPECSAPEGHNVLWIARFAEEKRPLDAIRVMKHVCEQVPDATLSVVGGGSKELRAQAQALCRELGIEDRVIFYGQQMDVSRFYKEAAVILMTSEFEGYPIVIIETMAHGRAMAMYSLPYLTMTKRGLGLRMAKQGDVKGLAAEVAAILSDKSLRKKLEEETVQSFAEFRDYDQSSLWKDIVREMEQPDTRKGSASAVVGKRAENAATVVDVANENGQLMISLLLNDCNRACKRAMKEMENYPDFRVGHAVLKIPRMINCKGRMFLLVFGQHMEYIAAYVRSVSDNMNAFVLRVVNGISNRLNALRRKRFVNKNRKRLKNKNFCIISSNCNGGVLCSDLGVPFNSPFVNMFMTASDFIKLLENFQSYMADELRFVQEEDPFYGNVAYPTAYLKDVKIYFMHYSSEAEAKEAWDKRKNRIDMKNLYIMFTDRSGCSQADLERFDKLPYRHKLVFTHIPHPEIQSAFYIKGFENEGKVPVLSDFTNEKHPVKRIYDQFDFVSWLNDE